MLRTMVVGVIVLISACCPQAHHRVQRATAIANTALIVCDLGQTLYVSDGGRWDRVGEHGAPLLERNPLLGRTPGASVIVTAAAIGVAANWILYASDAPEWLKTIGLSTVTGIEGANVAINYGGVCGLNQAGDITPTTAR